MATGEKRREEKEDASGVEGLPTTVNEEANAGESLTANDAGAGADDCGDVTYVNYIDERQLPEIMRMMDKELSEPYSIFTYRYFLNNWPNLCVMARIGGEDIGCIVCKAEHEKGGVYSGYIAMLAVEKPCRKLGIGSELVRKACERMRGLGCDEVVLETEVTNKGALGLYGKLGFARESRMMKYYLNGVDAFRLKLCLCLTNT